MDAKQINATGLLSTRNENIFVYVGEGYRQKKYVAMQCAGAEFYFTDTEAKSLVEALSWAILQAYEGNKENG